MWRPSWAIVLCLLAATACATQTSKRRQSSTRRRASSSGTGSHKRKQLANDQKQTYSLPSSIVVYPLGSDRKFTQPLECKKDESSEFCTLADVLSYCTAQLRLQAVPTKQWRFLDVEQNSMIRRKYSLDDSAEVMAGAVNSEGTLKIQLWQWKDVKISVEYQRIEWKAPITTDRFTFKDNSNYNVESMWQQKFPGTIMEFRDIDVFVQKTGEPNSKKPFEVDYRGIKPMFLLHAAYSVGEPLTLLLAEKEQECVISGEEILMDRNLIMKTRCHQRFLMSSWLQWLQPCPVCRKELCDICSNRIEADVKKFPCGHVFHQHCGSGNIYCRKCPSVFFEVTMPSGDQRFYEIKDRRNGREARTTPAMILRHLMEPGEDVPPALGVQISSGSSPRLTRISMDTELLRALEGNAQPYTIKFEAGTEVEFRLVGHLGEILKSETQRVEGGQVTIRQHLKRFTLDESVTVFKHDNNPREPKLMRVSNLNATIFNEMAGYERPRFDFVIESSIPFVVNNRTQECKIAINSIQQISPVEVLTYCARQLNIPAHSRRWTFDAVGQQVEDLDMEVQRDKVYASNSLLMLEFKCRPESQAPRVASTPESQAPSGQNTTGLSSDGRRIEVLVNIGHSRAPMSTETTCWVPANDSLTYDQLIDACLRSRPHLKDLSLNGMYLKKPDGSRYWMRNGMLIREWRHSPGAQLCLSVIIPP